MKSLTLILAFAAMPAWAGVTYDFQSASTGIRNGVLSGTVAVEGANVRMDLSSGDAFLFKDGSVVLSSDGGKTIRVFDPAAITYYVVNLADLTSAGGGLLSGMSDLFKVSFSNPRVSTRDLGDGGTIAGYPTRHAAVDAAYDIAIDAMGTKIATHMAMSTESWTTDRLSGAFTNFLQEKNIRTGFAELDKLIETQSGALHGRFPLKQVTTIRMTRGGGEMTSTTTSTVSNIRMKTLAAATFAAPVGYVKVDDPITRMAKNMR